MATTTQVARFTKGADRYYDIGGKRYPSVTTITGMLHKPALVNWAAKLTRERMCDEAAMVHAFDPTADAKTFRSALWKAVEKRAFQNEASREAADLGTLAHKRCEWIVSRAMGETVGPDPIETAAKGTDAERALWASLAFDQWVTDHDVKFIATEIVVHDPLLGYAGTADLVAYVDGRVAIVDLKTSSGVWPEMYLQVAAYWNAYNLSGDVRDNAVDAYILRLPKKLSDPEFEAVQIENLSTCLESFRALLTVFKNQPEAK